MAAEFEHHLAQDRAWGESRNHRNGATRERLLTGDSQVEVIIPRDREARFDPVLIGKYQRPLPWFDDKVISLYTRAMSTREIQGQLEEIYGAEVSPPLTPGHGVQQGGLPRPWHHPGRAQAYPELWIDPNEGEKFWLRIVNELRNQPAGDPLNGGETL